MEYILYFFSGIVLGTIILIISMIIASARMGGIDFGQIHHVIAKSIPLLVIIYGMGLIPYGSYLTAPVWWIGLMLIFRLDFWEVRTLVAVNGVLNWLATFALLLLTHIDTFRTILK